MELDFWILAQNEIQDWGKKNASRWYLNPIYFSPNKTVDNWCAGIKRKCGRDVGGRDRGIPFENAPTGLGGDQENEGGLCPVNQASRRSKTEKKEELLIITQNPASGRQKGCWLDQPVLAIPYPSLSTTFKRRWIGGGGEAKGSEKKLLAGTWLAEGPSGPLDLWTISSPGVECSRPLKKLWTKKKAGPLKTTSLHQFVDLQNRKLSTFLAPRYPLFHIEL